MKLVLEIGTEAIPADYLPPAIASLKERVSQSLAEARIDSGTIEVHATPKRLAILIEDLASRQRDEERLVRGPRKEIAFKDGEPTPPAIGFAKKNGVAVGDLTVVETDKGEFVEARVHVVGEDTARVLPDLLAQAVLGVPFPKTMKWNAAQVLFPRPIRWILALLDQEVLPVTIGGIPSGRKTQTHRLCDQATLDIQNAGSYVEQLKEARITLKDSDRRRAIEAQLQAEAEELGGRFVGEEDLLQEVTYLCEDPFVLTGSIDRAFLEMPREIVVTAMRSHQRYFAVESEEGDLLPHFLVICDGHWEDPSSVLAGNERVLRARLADARFYWDVDTKQGLDAMAEQLKGVVWLERVGSLQEKSRRVESLVRWLGPQLMPDWETHKSAASRAALLAKADLASEMIKDGKEFTGLQGVVAARYGQALGEEPAVCAALEEQYLPRGAGDPLPQTPAGTLLALGDRMDTVAGCFAAGLIPSGSQDPYALRRAANGMVRILMEGEFHLDLTDLVKRSIQELPPELQSAELQGDVVGFLRDRIAHFLRQEGIPHDVVEAVMAVGSADPLDAMARAKALEGVRGDDELVRLVVGYKRAANILKGTDGLPDPEKQSWESAEPAERHLWEESQRVGDSIQGSLDKKDYFSTISHLLTLREPIDTFFDQVMVMVEDETVRGRRLALLDSIRGLFTHLCDLSRIVLEGDK